MADARRLMELSMVGPLAEEVARQITAAEESAADIEAAIAAKTEIAALAAGPTVTYTSGSAPAVSGALTIANSATPTVTELLDYIVELNAKVDAIVAALKA